MRNTYLQKKKKSLSSPTMWLNFLKGNLGLPSGLQGFFMMGEVPGPDIHRLGSPLGLQTFKLLCLQTGLKCMVNPHHLDKLSLSLSDTQRPVVQAHRTGSSSSWASPALRDPGSFLRTDLHKDLSQTIPSVPRGPWAESLGSNRSRSQRQ